MGEKKRDEKDENDGVDGSQENIKRGKKDRIARGWGLLGLGLLRARRACQSRGPRPLLGPGSPGGLCTLGKR